MSAARAAAAVHSVRDESLGNTAYFVVLEDRRAIVVDPRRDVAEHLDLAVRLGVTIVAVLETHLHADFVGGAREIAEASGARIYAAADAGLSFPHEPVRPGDVLEIGDARVGVVGTPGHTPEHVAYHLVAGSGEHVFSGGALIAGGAARTDLSGAGRTVELARAQFHSIRTLAALPGEAMLHPTHGAGSFCSAGPAATLAASIADERATNPLLAIEEEDAFVERLVAGFASYPRYFSHLREVNRVGAPLLRTLPPVTELHPLDAWTAVAHGAWLVDTRTIDAWSRAHPAGAVSIELRPAFSSWLGWVVPFGAPVVMVAERERAAEAVGQARRIGYDDIAGWLGFESWREAGLPVSSVQAIGADEAARRSENGAVLLDVRSDAEHRAGHLPGATHLELGDIIVGKTPGAGEVVTYCGHGERSATAASLLARRGVRVANLAGGIGAWEQWRRDHARER